MMGPDVARVEHRNVIVMKHIGQSCVCFQLAVLEHRLNPHLRKLRVWLVKAVHLCLQLMHLTR